MSTLLQKVQSGELNPIIYMPMASAVDCHINYGTGGNMVQNGTLATADRGANQDNCVASYFDGVDDYLSRTIAVSSKSITMSFIVNKASVGGNTTVLMSDSSGNSIVLASNTLTVYLRKALNVELIWFRNITLPLDSTNLVSLSVKDLTLSGASNINAKIYINGIDKTDIVQYSTGNMTFSYINLMTNNGATGFARGSLGEFYFDTNYIDLATNNPFWDSKTNKPIPVRKAMANLGSNPLICMPIDASNPTKNYGSGGDFTLFG